MKKANADKLKESRSYNMSRIKSCDTAIEIVFRKALWHRGVRYRKNAKFLPGKPDIAITKHKIAIFCDGEFWHGKDWDIKKSKIHKNHDYWINKIERNISRDALSDVVLYKLGWTVLRFWGNDIERNLQDCVNEVFDAIIQKRIDSQDITDVSYWHED